MDNTHTGHRARMRERFHQSGIESFQDHEVLEMLLYYVYPRSDTNPIAHKMIQEFGTLHNLFESDPLEIASRCNVSLNVATIVSLVPSLAHRYFTAKWDKKEVLDTSKKAGLFCIAQFTGYIVECFYAICLDNQRGLIFPACISKGTIAEAPVYTRELVATALKHQAASVILAHNHPSGALTPSRGDIVATKKMVEALKTINVEVVDHIIVGGNAYFSFSESKTLPFWY